MKNMKLPKWKKWKRPRKCKTCGHEHLRPEEAKTADGKRFFCTWCSDLAPQLR